MPSNETVRLNPSSTPTDRSSSSSLRSRLHLLLPLLLSAVLLTSSNMPFRKPSSKPISSVDHATATPTTSDPSFSLRVFAHLASESTSQNPVLSPISLAYALALLQHAATTPGPALKQLQTLLPNPPTKTPLQPSSSETSFQLASSIWTSSSINKSYASSVSETLSAIVNPLPSSVGPINEWISQQTNAQIPSLLTSLPESVIALLLSVVHFHASWTTRFDKHRTKPRPFYNAPTQIPFMHSYDNSYRFASIPIPEHNLGPKMLLLPYGSQTPPRFHATFLVPASNDPPNALDTIITLLKTKPHLWSDWQSTAKSTELEVVAIPQFRLDHEPTSLKPVLNSLNISDIFLPNPIAPPLTRLTNDPDAFVDDLLHKVVVECNEEGTQMSAASAVVIKTRSLVIGKPTFVADRPFLFAIHDSLSPHILLIARVDRPDLS